MSYTCFPPFLFRIIRYEDLMLDLDGEIPQLLSLLGLPMQASVGQFVYKNKIKGNGQSPFGGNPIETMNRWKVCTSNLNNFKAKNFSRNT